MAFTNNVMIVRHGLMAKLVKLWKENRLLDEIDRLPIELSPRKSKVIGRCCVHKERAVWKYKTLPLLGFDMQDEVDELTPLSEYAKRALLRPENKKENLMCVVDEACSSCVQVNYEITNLCRGCVARSCYMNCPKDAIQFKKNGQARIDHDTCISCGKCHRTVLTMQLFIYRFLVKKFARSRLSAKMNTAWSISTNQNVSTAVNVSMPVLSVLSSKYHKCLIYCNVCAIRRR